MLSEQQKAILVGLLACERPGLEMAVRDRWGGGYHRWLVEPLNGYSRSDQASISRAVRRLEGRGLVKRLNAVSKPGLARRTTHVALTDEGRAIAEAVNKIHTDFC
jgi:DNA-binding MarR family transcriptional regulator